MFIQNTVRLFAGAFILTICAFGQISIVVSPTPITTTRTSNLPPVGIAGGESAQVILTNTAANPAKKTHDEQADNCISTIVRWIASNEHTVQGVDACREQVNVRKTWQVHFGFSLKVHAPPTKQAGRPS